MARKKRKSDGPSKAYLISFGDTMTALLAFFIVLNSLANEQTGADLHAGTGSFITALKSFGLSGTFLDDTSQRAFQAKVPNAIYNVIDSQDGPPDENPRGPDKEENRLRVIDRDKEQFERFLIEMEHLYSVEELPQTQGRVVYDLFDRLNSQSPLLKAQHQRAMADVVPLLRRPHYRVEIVVWATTPAATAWKRATLLSAQIRDEILQVASLKPDEALRLQSVAKPWLLPGQKRPVLSVVVIKDELSY
jgi:flagellar motor protein MotB